MNREKVFGLASEAIATRVKQMIAQEAEVSPGPAESGRRLQPYDRSAFLYDLAHQLAEAEGDGRRKPATDEGWADVIAQSYLARTAEARS